MESIGDQVDKQAKNRKAANSAPTSAADNRDNQISTLTDIQPSAAMDTDTQNTADISRDRPTASVSENEYGYQLWLEPVNDSMVEARFRLLGWIRNISTEIWASGFGIGLHNFRDADGQIIASPGFRGEFARLPVYPGDEISFSFDINPEQIPSRAITCEIDMVQENIRWFKDSGSDATIVALSGFRNVHARREAASSLMTIYKSASETERRKIKIIADVLKAYDFSGIWWLKSIKDIALGRAFDLPYRQPNISSETLEAIEAGRDCNRSDAFLDGFACKQAGNPNIDVRIIDLFKIFVQHKQGFFRSATPPVPARFSQFLNSRALPPDLAQAPVTRAMIATLGQDSPISFNNNAAFADLSWRYLTTVLIDNNMPVSLIPDSVSLDFASSPMSGDYNLNFPAPTKFMLKLLADSEDYRQRYDVGTEAGRCAFAFDLLALGAENEVRRHCLGRDILDWLTRPVGPSLALSPFEILAMANFDLRGTDYLTGIAGPNSRVINALRSAYDWLPRPAPVTSYNLRVVGLAQGERSASGLGTNMQMSVDILNALNIAMEQVDADTGMITPASTNGRQKFQRPVDLYHLNCDDLPGLVARYSTRDRPNPFRIGFALWESSTMPEEHRAGALLMDELWVPTKYIENIYRNAGFDNVKVVGKGIKIDEFQPVSREKYGIKNDNFVFITSFDISSWLERKNPAAIIDAFSLAFPNDPNVRLVIKTTGIFAYAGDRTGQVTKIMAAANADRRILMINERTSFDKYLGIIGMGDALISAHRSEGFGYLPAYAMLQKIPVIVTDHSGTTDFCTEKTSFPVRCTLVDIKQGDFVYHADGARWADIHIPALAEAMIKVRTDYPEAKIRARNGHEFVSTHYSMAAMAERYLYNLQDMFSIKDSDTKIMHLKNY